MKLLAISRLHPDNLNANLAQQSDKTLDELTLI